MHYIEHSIGLCTELCTDNYRLCRFLVLMKSLNPRYYHQLHLKPWAKSPEEAASGR
jgi:hypothetical protein